MNKKTKSVTIVFAIMLVIGLLAIGGFAVHDMVTGAQETQE